jgi:hypothetical protein
VSGSYLGELLLVEGRGFDGRGVEGQDQGAKYGASALLRSVAVVSVCPESARAMVTDRLDEFGGRDDEGAC